MNKEVLYVLLPDYAAHEMVYLSEAIASDEFALKENPKYVNKVVAPTLEPVKSIGGFRVIPDYSFDTMPEDYAALVLIGGFGWTTPVAEKVAPIVSKAIEAGKVMKQPKSYIDVKAQVTSDYQAECERLWVEKLRKQFTFTVNEDVLKTVK